MSTTHPTEAESFQLFLSKELRNGGRHKSPEELVQLWRLEQRELQESIADLEVAIAEMEAGDVGRPLEEVAREIRQKHGWAEK